MTESTISNDIQTLIQEGNAALLAGDTYEARQRFRRVLELDAANVEALLGLAGAVRPYREKRDFLQRVLEIDPQNSEAQASLSVVENKLAAGEVLAPKGVMVPEPTGLLNPQPTPEIELSTPTEVEYCYLHPDRETGLQCTQCNRPICSQCLVRAPVGQLCPECARMRRPRNYQVSAGNLMVAAAVSLILAMIVSFLGLMLLGQLPFFFGAIAAFFLGPVIGEFLVRILDRLTHAKRGKEMQVAVGVSFGVGAAPFFLLFALFLPLVLLIGLALITAVTRLR